MAGNVSGLEPASAGDIPAFKVLPVPPGGILPLPPEPYTPGYIPPWDLSYGFGIDNGIRYGQTYCPYTAPFIVPSDYGFGGSGIPARVAEGAAFIPAELIITFAPKRILGILKTDDIHRAISRNFSAGIVFRECRHLVRNEKILLGQCPIDLVILQLNNDRGLQTAIEAYKNNPYVMGVEPNGKLNFTAFPNDPQFSTQWNMYNNGQAIPVLPLGLAYYYTSYPSNIYFPGPPPALQLPVDALGIPILHADIDTVRAWDALALWPHPLKETVVAVIDQGVQYDHPDIYPNMKFNLMEAVIDPITGKYIPDGNGKDDDNNGFIDDFCGWDLTTDYLNLLGLYAGGEYQIDLLGHGTAISGIVAAVGNNGIGIAGINWTGVKILPLKAAVVGDVIEAIEYAISNGAAIINSSWDIGPTPILALEQEIQRAETAGVLFVTGAGNDFEKNLDIDPIYPASYPELNIISVAATDNLDNLAYFSNYGLNSVDLAAPGQSVYVAWSTLAPYPYDPAQIGLQYTWATGSSFSSAHVAGVAAMVWAAHPFLDYLGVRTAILGGTEPNPTLAGKTVTGGDLNAYKALTYY